MKAIKIQVGELLFQFTSFSDWVNNASRRFKTWEVRGDETLCIDKKGRVCLVVRQFIRARDEKTYPINVYRATV